MIKDIIDLNVKRLRFDIGIDVSRGQKGINLFENKAVTINKVEISDSDTNNDVPIIIVLYF